jgi:tRNA(Arg) A34 adenosine deaminase TadA
MDTDTQQKLPDFKWLELVSQLSMENVASGNGGPFAAVVIRNGELIASSCNEVLISGDPTAHAEVSVIRKACKQLGTFQLDDCVLISSCEPCPMCLGAIYWARPQCVYFINTREEAASIGFDDQFIYDEIALRPDQRHIPFLKVDYAGASKAFQTWKNKMDKTPY